MRPANALANYGEAFEQVKRAEPSRKLFDDRVWLSARAVICGTVKLRRWRGQMLDIGQPDTPRPSDLSFSDRMKRQARQEVGKEKKIHTASRWRGKFWFQSRNDY